MKRLAILAALCGVVAVPTARAQEQATVLKRDGTRVTGRFEAWNRNNNSLYIRVTPGDQRILPLGDVAMFEVAGPAENLPAAELDAARGGDHVLVLRSGEILRGRLINIEGGEGSGMDDIKRIMSFKPNDGAERRPMFADVRRLYLGSFPASLMPSSATPLPETPLEPGQIRVRANARWVSTGITVTRTDRVQFTTSGEVRLSGDPEDMAGPAGSRRGRRAPNAPLPGELAGALVGRVGNGPAFGIGDQSGPLPMAGDGELFLAVNDDEVGDNQGSFVVTVRVERRRR